MVLEEGPRFFVSFCVCVFCCYVFLFLVVCSLLWFVCCVVLFLVVWFAGLFVFFLGFSDYRWSTQNPSKEKTFLVGKNQVLAWFLKCLRRFGRKKHYCLAPAPLQWFMFLMPGGLSKDVFF